MSLSYNEMYNITAGIYMVFSSPKNNVRTLSVNHRQKKRDTLEAIFPTNDYSNYTRENFIITNLYMQFHSSPSSLIGSIEKLRDIDKKDVWKFKDEIIHYRRYLQEDLNKIKTQEGNNPGLDYMVKEYRNNNIKWYTFYFYLVVSNTDIEELSKSRVNGFLIRKIQKLLLYVTFSEKSMLLVKEILKDTIDI